MIHWKLEGMMGEVNGEGHFRPIRLSVEERSLDGECMNREEAFDSLDTFVCMARDTLAKGQGVMMTLYEYEDTAEKEGRKLGTILTIRGYREAGKDPETGEILYTEDDDDSDHAPTYCRYDKQYVKFMDNGLDMNFDAMGNIIDDDGNIVRRYEDMFGGDESHLADIDEEDEDEDKEDK